MPIKRRKYDPFDAEGRQPYDTVESGNVRIRIFSNITPFGLRWKFDVVYVVLRPNHDDMFHGIPLDEAANLIDAAQKLFEWTRRNR